MMYSMRKFFLKNSISVSDLKPASEKVAKSSIVRSDDGRGFILFPSLSSFGNFTGGGRALEFLGLTLDIGLMSFTTFYIV